MGFMMPQEQSPPPPPAPPPAAQAPTMASGGVAAASAAATARARGLQGAGFNGTDLTASTLPGSTPTAGMSLTGSK